MNDSREQKNLLKFDKCFPKFHDVGEFSVSLSIPDGVDFNDDKSTYLIPPVSIISDILSKYGYATITKDNYPDYLAELTDKGREAKKAGGHFAYLKQLADKEEKRQHTKDLIDHFDLFIKKWTYKSRYLPYLASFGALTVSILVYLNQRSKQTEQQVQQEIQSLKEQTKKQDSLFHLNNPLKKDSLSNQ